MNNPQDASRETMNNEQNPNDQIPKVDEVQEREWIAEFEASMRRPLPLRMKYSFIKTYKPVLDDAPYRSFETMAEYREWCEKNLPSWLGYGKSL